MVGIVAAFIVFVVLVKGGGSRIRNRHYGRILIPGVLRNMSIHMCFNCS